MGTSSHVSRREWAGAVYEVGVDERYSTVWSRCVLSYPAIFHFGHFAL